MSTRSNTIWTFAITSVALFMVTLDNLVVTTALPVIRKDLHASLSQLEWTVNAYTLTFAVLLLTGRGARRPVRAQADVLGRDRDLHVVVRRGRARSECHRARPGARCAGRGRRDRDAAHADDPVRGGSAGAARAGAWCLERDRRSRGRDRTARRRRRRRRDLVAVDLLAQRADRADPRAARVPAPARIPRPGRPARPRRPGPRQRRPVRDRVGPRARQRGRLGQRRDRRLARRRLDRPRACSCSGS